jgi:O-antigen ligase
MNFKISSRNFIIYLFFFSLNFETLNTFNTGVDFLITKITILLLFLYSLLNYKSLYSIRDYAFNIYPILIFFGLLIVLNVIHRNPAHRTFIHLAFLINILIFIVLSNHSTNKHEILLKGLLSFAMGIILITLIYIFNSNLRTVGIGNRNTIFDNNANDMGIKLVICMFILLSVIFENKLLLGRARYLLLIFFPFLLKFMIDTGSRVAFIAFFLGAATMFFIYIKRLGLSRKVNLMIIGGFVAVLLTFIIIKNNTLIQRLSDSFNKGDLSTRDQIWGKVTPIISKHLYWGVGETGYSRIMGQTSPHNVFLEVLAYTGIAGFIVFLLFFGGILTAAIKKLRFSNDLLPLVLLIPILGVMLSGQIFEQKIYWGIFAYIVGDSALSLNKHSQKKFEISE